MKWCGDRSTALISAFGRGSLARNQLAPADWSGLPSPRTRRLRQPRQIWSGLCASSSSWHRGLSRRSPRGNPPTAPGSRWSRRMARWSGG